MRRMRVVLAAFMVIAAAPEPALHQVEATGVLGRSVRDSDKRDIGRIVDVVVDPSGQPEAVVVDTGGFMGVGARRVAVAWAAVHVPPPGDTDTAVTIDLSDDQVRAAPAYNDRTKPATVVGPPDLPAVLTPAVPVTAPDEAPAAAGGKAADP